jgi:hypothetical protein
MRQTTRRRVCTVSPLSSIASLHTYPCLSRAYCSDDCESLDVTSPSISTTSSTSPSPHLLSSNSSSTAADRDIPALLPSALGGSPLHVYARYRKMNHTTNSFSRYQVSSTNLLSPYSDTEHYHDHDENSSIHNDIGYQDPAEKPPSASLSSFHTSVTPSGLSYARKPSSTNHHSTVPLLHCRSSSGASSPTRPVGIPQSAPSPMALQPYSSSTEDELSDTPEKDSTVRGKQSNTPLSKDVSKKRNRASLPAYFSLLQLSSTTSPPRRKSSTFSSQSAPKRSPPTPHISDHGFSIAASSTSAVTPATVLANCVTSAPQVHERGRSKRRGESSPLAPSSRSHSRFSSPPVHMTVASKSSRQPRHMSQSSRRIDSVEKVADWVGTSIGASGKRKSHSLFPAPPIGDEESEDDENWENERTSERRGRKRAHELDSAPDDAKDAPGFGSGRSGLKDRERRGIVLGLASGANLSILEVGRRDR